MKKLTYLLASAAILAACQSQPTSYTITGTIGEGSDVQDNTLAVLAKGMGRNTTYLDSAEVQNKQFVFEGQADSAQLVRLEFYNKGEQRPYSYVNLMLENGKINVNLQADKNTIGGTTNNDMLNVLNTKSDSVNTVLKTAYEATLDSTLSEADRTAKIESFKELRNSCNEDIQNTYKTFIQNNIGNQLGYTYFIMYGASMFTVEEQEALIAKVPANYANSEAIQEMKSRIEIEKKTAVGQKFTDFAMKTPDGKDIKLSDVVAKNKVTLVDFWASWCGPCRAEMPNVVKDYKTFKNKGLGIVGVSLDNDAEQWKKAIKDLGITWEQMSDLKGWECEGARLYNVRGIPATVLIAQDGTIVAKDLRGEELTKKLAELLK